MSWCDSIDGSPCGSCLLVTAAVILGPVFILCFLTAYLVLGRKFDRIVGQGSGPDFYAGLLGKLALRPTNFALLIVVHPDWARIERRKGRERIETHPAAFWVRDYGGIDYRAQASWFQIVFSWAYITSGWVAMLIGGVLWVCKNLL